MTQERQFEFTRWKSFFVKHSHLFKRSESIHQKNGADLGTITDNKLAKLNQSEY